MSFQAIVYKVMIASPSDVIREKTIIREIINEWNIINSNKQNIVLLPVGWETNISPEMGNHPQKIINNQILKDCDLLIGVFWTRIGTSTEEYKSGTIEEIEEHIKKGKPAMLYFSNIPIVPESIEQEQYSELKIFKESLKSRGLIETYNDINDFKSKFNRQLQLKINDNDYFVKTENKLSKLNMTETNIPNIPELSNEAQILLKEAYEDRNGRILRIPIPEKFGGISIQSNGKHFNVDKSPKTRAIWEGVIEELKGYNLIKQSDLEGHKFKLTRKGYEITELLRQ